MPHSQFVENVSIGSSEVGDRVSAKDQPLEHGLVDDPAAHLFIGTQRLQLGIADSRSNKLLVHRIEVDEQAIRVRLGPKRHQHKTKWLIHERHLSLKLSFNLNTTGLSLANSSQDVAKNVLTAKKIIGTLTVK